MQEFQQMSTVKYDKEKKQNINSEVIAAHKQLLKLTSKTSKLSSNEIDQTFNILCQYKKANRKRVRLSDLIEISTCGGAIKNVNRVVRTLQALDQDKSGAFDLQEFIGVMKKLQL